MGLTPKQQEELSKGVEKIKATKDKILKGVDKLDGTEGDGFHADAAKARFEDNARKNVYVTIGIAFAIAAVVALALKLFGVW